MAGIIFGRGESPDDETLNLIILFVGVMFGVNTANAAISKISISAAIGVKMTKEIFAKSVSKSIPIIGALTSGALTYATFKPMASTLKDYLLELKFCSADYYNVQRESLNQSQSVL